MRHIGLLVFIDWVSSNVTGRLVLCVIIIILWVRLPHNHAHLLEKVFSLDIGLGEKLFKNFIVYCIHLVLLRQFVELLLTCASFDQIVSKKYESSVKNVKKLIS